MLPPLCIYHRHCPDGFAAAWVVRRAFLGDVEFLPASYGDAPPDVTERQVFIVDFSYEKQADAADMQMEADFALMSGELSRVIPALIEVLGGEQPDGVI